MHAIELLRDGLHAAMDVRIQLEFSMPKEHFRKMKKCKAEKAALVVNLITKKIGNRIAV